MQWKVNSLWDMDILLVMCSGRYLICNLTRCSWQCDGLGARIGDRPEIASECRAPGGVFDGDVGGNSKKGNGEVMDGGQCRIEKGKRRGGK
jgi:hypothetical protein